MEYMLNESELYNFLDKKVPGLKSRLQAIDDTKSPYKILSTFGDYTRELIEASDISNTLNCLLLAEYILKEGTHSIRRAVTTVFLYSILRSSAFKSRCMDELPPLLKMEYKKQHSV